MKLRIRRLSDSFVFEADSGSGYVEQKQVTLPGFPVSGHVAVTAPGSVPVTTVTERSEL